MANLLTVDKQEAIRLLAQKGWSIRKISKKLGIHRDTVKRYKESEDQKAHSGPETGDLNSKCTGQLTGKPEQKQDPSGSKCTGVLTGIFKNSQSKCLVHYDYIAGKIIKDLSAQRIYQDLRQDKAFEGSYSSVRRFVRTYKAAHPERVWRMECEPGEEVQVDFGSLRLLRAETGRLKMVHIFRMTLSHSRKAYSEAVLHQNSESFLRCLENAFRYFGGVCRYVCLDNLRAAVKKADWYEPEINPKLRSFARHYGFITMPTRPATPEHKGKVESAIKYVQNNCLKGKLFDSLAEINECLHNWERQVADQRIHGTTRKQVQKHFLESEKAALQALPAGCFECFEEGKRKVHRDSYVEVEKAYYEVPEEYIGHRLWVRWDARMVRVYSLKMELIVSHSRLEKGKYSRVLGLYGVPESVEKSIRYWQRRLERIGPATACWIERMIQSDDARVLRRLQGLNGLLGKHTYGQIEQACTMASLHGQYRLHDLKRWLKQPPQQQVFSYLKEHELIRDMAVYGQIAGPDFPSQNPPKTLQNEG